MIKQATVPANFAAFIAPVKIRAGLLWLLIGIFFATAIYLIGAAMIMAGGFAFLDESELIRFQVEQKFTTPKMMLVILPTFFAMWAGVWATVRFIHKRDLISVIMPQRHRFWRNMGLAALFIWGLVGSMMILFPSPDPLVENTPFKVWLSWMPLALPLILMQVAAEETVFRGYIQQHLAARFQHPLVWMILPSLIFGLLHYQPALMGSNTWFAVVQTTVLGIILADLTMRTGNLGAAIGIHFANNVVAMCFTAIDGALSGFSRYTLPVDLNDEETLRQILISEVSATLVIVAIYAFVVWRWYRN